MWVLEDSRRDFEGAYMTTSDDNQSAGQTLQYSAEKARINLRRKCLALDNKAPPERHWALALSGGGIRSATFAQGVLQAMARAPAPEACGRCGETAVSRKLLPHFDYLSTVSGGGYIGSFFGSLFIPGRLSLTEKKEGEDGICRQSVKDAGELAYKVFEFEPPGRIHSNKDYEFTSNPGEGPMAWLRENGRYLLPNGSGDLFYAIALSIRNFLAVHFVIGMPLLFLLTLCILASVLLGDSSLCTPGGELSDKKIAPWVCTSLWGLPLVWFAVAVMPLILAFWMVYAQESQEERARALNLSLALHVIAAAGFATAGFYLPPGSKATAILCWVVAAIIGWAVVLQLLMTGPLKLLSSRDDCPGGILSVRSFRVVATRRLSEAFLFAGLLFFLALVVETSHFAYAKVVGGWNLAYTPSAVLVGLIVLIKKISTLFDEKTLPSWFQKVPVNVIAGVVGVVMLFSLAVLWGMAVEWVRWNGGVVSDPLCTDAWLRLSGLLVASFLLTFMSGQFIGFLNLSSLHAFYSSRLARAYLGASNRRRFKTFKPFKNRHSDKADDHANLDRQFKSVADALVGDDVLLETYYGTQTCAPVHLINVTMNLTVDPGEQLVQRERKGKPLCLAPNFYPAQHDMDVVSYILDGEPRTRSTRHKWFSEITQPLSLSHWVATSGAAVTTGLGRATTLGTSLALGLANVRLGCWWPCNFIDSGEGKHDQREWKDTGLARVLPTQTYLFYELTATFHGYRRDFQYLSDGGHFENTAAYELLRKGRQVELIVLCDSGCDQAYGFDDVANLIRLARIDHALEIEEDLDIQKHPVLGKVFFSMKEFAEPARLGPQGCAVMLDVYDKDRHMGLRCKILVLKPWNIADLPADVQNYAKTHPAFPNETTADQSFDEAQFESYRQLGLNMGQLLFGEPRADQPDVAAALWTYLQGPGPGSLKGNAMRY